MVQEVYEKGYGTEVGVKKDNSTLNSDESTFTFASSVATLPFSPNMNISSHSFIIPFFIIPICLSAACLHCHAPSLLHRGASSSCSFALVMYVLVSLIHFSSPLFVSFSPVSQNENKITSVVTWQK